MKTKPKKAGVGPRLRVGANAEKLMRALLASSDPADLRRMASNPHGRTELERLQRVAAARVAEFQSHLELAKDVESTFSAALQTATREG